MASCYVNTIEIYQLFPTWSLFWALAFLAVAFEGGGAFAGWILGKHLADQHLLEGKLTASRSG